MPLTHVRVPVSMHTCVNIYVRVCVRARQYN